MNLRESEDRKIWITSDLHFGHQRDFVWKDRGYADVPAHDNGVVEGINSKLRPNDILIMLGDWCLNTTLEQFDLLLSKINCQNIYCLWGNHNNPHEKKVYQAAMSKMFPNKSEPFPTEMYPFRYKNMVYLGHYVEAVLNGQFIVLQHYPLIVWNEMKNGAWMLCGHSHNGCPATIEESTHGKILDVGWDGHKGPWSMEEISEVMGKKRFVATDSHHQ